MTGRERVLKALNHEEADRVPFDLGGGRSCGIAFSTYKKLVEYLGIDVKPVIGNFAPQTARVDEVVYKKLGMDFRPVRVKSPHSWSLDLKEEEDHYWFIDEWQSKRKMPKGGYYYDIVSFPLAEIPLDEYKWPDPTDPGRFEGIEESIKKHQENSDASLVFSRGPGNGFLQMGAQLYGYERWFMMLATEPVEVERFLDRYMEFKLAFWDALLDKIGDKVDVVCEVDDLGTQRSQWISLDMYRKLIKPRHQKFFSFIKKKAPVKVFLHSCGSIFNFIPDLIDAGVDILNPVQVTAEGMDTKRLKEEFGKDLIFWGGGIDTQHILPYGTKKEIREEVKRRIHDLAPGGGFVFAAVHHIQHGVPPENVVAMIEAFQEFSSY